MSFLFLEIFYLLERSAFRHHVLISNQIPNVASFSLTSLSRSGLYSVARSIGASRNYYACRSAVTSLIIQILRCGTAVLNWLVNSFSALERWKLLLSVQVDGALLTVIMLCYLTVFLIQTRWNGSCLPLYCITSSFNNTLYAFGCCDVYKM